MHDNGATGQFFMPEMLGSGVALFDYDNDGDLDVYLVQDAPIDGTRPHAGNRLFRNDGRRSGRAFRISPTSPRGWRRPEARSAWASPSVTSTTMAGSTST